MKAVLHCFIICCVGVLVQVTSIVAQAPSSAAPQHQEGGRNQTRVAKGKAAEEVLTSLTDEERSLDLRALISNQPDFAADLKFFVAEHKIDGAYGFEYRVVRKGNRFREESEFWIFVGEIGKTTARLFPREKTYDDKEPPRGESTEEGGLLWNPRIMLAEASTTITALGTPEIDGHKCIKIEVTRKTKPGEIYLYAAVDLKNLIITAQKLGPESSTVASLSNITLGVPDHLVEIPSDFKVIERDRWVKLETAKLTYGGRPSQDFFVFQAPGGELFIRVNDWTYLVRPKLRTVETAFRGLLVTRSGQYVWETKESEAFSKTSYRQPRPPGPYERSEEERRVVVTPNSVKFRSTDYNRDKAMIEIRW